MQPCASGILMAALTLGLVLVDFYNFRLGYAGEHALLGGIISILFFGMCNYGLEMINWIVLAIIPVYIFIKWYFSSPNESEEPSAQCSCEEEIEPTCSKYNNKRDYDEDSYKAPRINCPAKPLRIGSQCGISRAT